jgi:anti-sigma28 factor (negative regulator of flagellin synthesis)
MKVYDNNLASTSAAQTGRTQETQKLDRFENSRARAAAAGSEDRVELSSTLGSLSKAIAAYGSSRASQVQALAAQYQSGNYRTESLATSRGMVSEALGAGIE